VWDVYLVIADGYDENIAMMKYSVVFMMASAVINKIILAATLHATWRFLDIAPKASVRKNKKKNIWEI
jgi:hypothetical protein